MTISHEQARAARENMPRLTDEAMGPCAICSEQLLKIGLPVFYRFEMKQCALDMREIQRHVGLAQSIAPGRDGLALAAVMGPGVKPVVVMGSPPAINVCLKCASAPTMAMQLFDLGAQAEVKAAEAKAAKPDA